jgi:SLOG cluster2
MARATTATRKLLFSRVSCVDVNSEAVGPRIAQILFAGKAFGFLGIMPGIAEEAMCALNANLAVYVVGAFGSAARLLAESLTTSELPDAFTHDSHESNAIFRRMLEGAKNAGCDDAPTEAFQKLQATLKTVGEDLNQLHNGLNGA